MITSIAQMGTAYRDSRKNPIRGQTKWLRRKKLRSLRQAAGVLVEPLRWSCEIEVNLALMSRSDACEKAAAEVDRLVFGALYPS